VTLRGDSGTRFVPDPLRLLACLDQQCVTQVQRQPGVLLITYSVRANIQVQQQVTVQRTGQDPAMPLVLPVTVPPAAGTVQMALSGRTDAILMTFQRASIGIMPAQVRAGQYVVQATLQGSADPRYVQTVTVHLYRQSGQPAASTRCRSTRLS